MLIGDLKLYQRAGERHAGKWGRAVRVTDRSHDERSRRDRHAYRFACDYYLNGAADAPACTDELRVVCARSQALEVAHLPSDHGRGDGQGDRLWH